MEVPIRTTNEMEQDDKPKWGKRPYSANNFISCK